MLPDAHRVSVSGGALNIVPARRVSVQLPLRGPVTQILNCVVRSGFALQVTDRLVTAGGRPVDSLANKNIVYVARNGVISLAYTGLAYIGSTPTDKWLAEKLAGRVFDDLTSWDPNGVSHWYDAGAAIKFLKESLKAAPRAMKTLEGRNAWVANDFAISASGWWSNSRGQDRPFTAIIRKNSRTEAVRHQYFDTRYWKPGDGFLDAVPKYPETGSALGRAKPAVVPTDPLASRRALVDAIKSIGSRVPVVGCDPITILMSPPSMRTVIVKFVSDNHPRAIDIRTGRPDTILNFSPWVMGPSAIASPWSLGGTRCAPELNVGGLYRVKLEVEATKSGHLVMGFGPHPRKRGMH